MISPEPLGAGAEAKEGAGQSPGGSETRVWGTDRQGVGQRRENG